MSSIIKVDTIQKADGTAGTIENLGLATGALSHRNLIINGAMQVAQRGTSFTGITNGKFPIDRFALYSTGGGSFNTEQSTDSPSGLSNSLKITVATADSSIASGDYYIFNQKLEGLNTAHLKFGTSLAQNVTLSFYVKSSLTGTFSGSITNGDYDRAYPFTYTISSANTWERKTISLDGDTSGTWDVDNSNSMSIWWDLGIGTTYTDTTSDSWRTTPNGKYGVSGQTQLIGTSSATWQITGVQLEVGSVATPFEHRSYGEELARCKRYLYRIESTDVNNRFYLPMGTYNTTTQLVIPGVFPVEMRTTPSLAIGGLSGYDIEPFDVTPTSIELLSGITNTQAYLIEATDPTARTRGYAGTIFVDTTTAYIEFDAEL